MLAGPGPNLFSSDSSSWVAMKVGAGAEQPICCAAHREFCDDFGGGPAAMCQTPALPKSTLSPQKCPSRVRYKAEIGPTAGNKRPRGCVGRGSRQPRLK